MSLILPTPLAVQIIEHAIGSLPNEAVGLLAGREHTAHRAFPLRNITAPGTFFADPYDQFTAERAIQSAGLELLAIYHSHPDGCTCLSNLDVALAAPWKCAHVVIALDTKGKTAQLRAHRLEGTSLEAVEILCPDGKLHEHGFACEFNASQCEQHPAQ